MINERAFLRRLAFYGLREFGGVNGVIGLIKNAQANGEIDGKMSRKLMGSTRTISKTSKLANSGLIKDIDNKIKNSSQSSTRTR